MNREIARFNGKVHIQHPQIKLFCNDLTVDLPAAGGQVTNMVADGAVDFDLINEQGQKIHGTGQKAVYTYGVARAVTNDFVVLTGSPVLVTTNGTFTNSVFILDRANNKIIAPGKYHFGSQERAETNLFPTPKK